MVCVAISSGSLNKGRQCEPPVRLFTWEGQARIWDRKGIGFGIFKKSLITVNVV